MAVSDGSWPSAKHAEVLDRLRLVVAANQAWRWLEVGCSIGAGRADELSDIDAGIGYMPEMPSEFPPGWLEASGIALIQSVGPTAGYLVHTMAGRPSDTIRLAVEYRSGVQLDLVLMPATNRPGLPDGSIAVVDKDGQLTRQWTPAAAGPPSADLAREWTMLGWWAISDVTKYVRRGALFEAVERIGEARRFALQLYAAAGRVPYPSFGLTSLLDFPPFELPAGLDATYPAAVEPTAVMRAVTATAKLLGAACAAAETTLAVDLATEWSEVAAGRMELAADAVSDDHTEVVQ